MRTYATNEDFLRHCGSDETIELSEPDNPDAILARGDRIAAALRIAAGEINAAIGERYDINSIPELANYFLNWINCAIGRQVLDIYTNREKVEIDANLARERLKAIRDGKESLFDLEGRPLPLKKTFETSSGGMFIASRSASVPTFQIKRTLYE